MQTCGHVKSDGTPCKRKTNGGLCYQHASGTRARSNASVQKSNSRRTSASKGKSPKKENMRSEPKAKAKVKTPGEFVESVADKLKTMDATKASPKALMKIVKQSGQIDEITSPEEADELYTNSRLDFEMNQDIKEFTAKQLKVWQYEIAKLQEEEKADRAESKKLSAWKRFTKNWGRQTAVSRRREIEKKYNEAIRDVQKHQMEMLKQKLKPSAAVATCYWVFKLIAIALSFCAVAHYMPNVTAAFESITKMLDSAAGLQRVNTRYTIVNLFIKVFGVTNMGAMGSLASGFFGSLVSGITQMFGSTVAQGGQYGGYTKKIVDTEFQMTASHFDELFERQLKGRSSKRRSCTSN